MKKNKWLFIAICALALTAGILAWANARRLNRLDPATLTLSVRGEEVGSISIEELSALGGEQFTQVLRGKDQEPVENTYTGLPLLEVLRTIAPGLDVAGAQVSVLANDGYPVAYSGEDVMRPEHIYLVWLRDGKKLGVEAEGGMGPLLVIPRQDPFGQFWCKYAVAVEVR